MTDFIYNSHAYRYSLNEHFEIFISFFAWGRAQMKIAPKHETVSNRI